ncbi:hypothetical protein ACFQUX_22560 [Pantoea stewartii]
MPPSTEVMQSIADAYLAKLSGTALSEHDLEHVKYSIIGDIMDKFQIVATPVS